MENSPVKVSVIIPVFNEEKRIGYALESALFQRTDFPFEVIVVDDGSTDVTIQAIAPFQRAFENLVVVRNERNLGKGTSVRNAYAAAKGKYVHILDADDYFVSYDKLQKQADILDGDVGLVAVAHNTILLMPDRTIKLLHNGMQHIEGSYLDCIRLSVPHHTSTDLVRKINSSLPIEFETITSFRGDSAFLFYHVFASKKGIRTLSDVSSVYDFHGQGLWSRLTHFEKKDLHRNLYKALQESIVRNPSSLEHQILDSKLEELAIPGDSGKKEDRRHRPSLEETLVACQAVASRVFDPKIRERMFSGMHGLRWVDQVCEAVGRILMVQSGYHLLGREYDESKVAILAAGLQPKGGGVFAVIADLVGTHTQDQKDVLLVITGLAASDLEDAAGLLKNPRVTLCLIEGDTYLHRLQAILDLLYKAAPTRMYALVSHNDVVGCAAIQKGIAKEIALDFSFDHGTSLGISNSSVDKIIVKCPGHVDALAQAVHRGKFVLIPPLLRPKFPENPYKPLKNGSLTTASAAARSYKVEMKSEFEFCDIIPEVMKISRGKHYHYGPLTEGYKSRIMENLKARSIDPENFVHVLFAESLSHAFIDAGVDIYLHTFEVQSIRIGLEVGACGIPVISFTSKRSLLPEASEFRDPGQWVWSSPAELLGIIKSATKDELLRKSASARRYFDSHNNMDLNASRLLTLTGVPIPDDIPHRYELLDIIDNNVYGFEEISALWGAGPSVLSKPLRVVIKAIKGVLKLFIPKPQRLALRRAQRWLLVRLGAPG